MLFPLKIEDNKLALAMADPTETRIVSNIAANHGLTIIPFVATKNDINAAICRQYLGKDLSIQHEKTVLIVEDDNLLGTMWSHILAKDGYRVKVAADGMDAIKRYFECRRLSSWRRSIKLMPMVFDVCTSRKHAIPIILLTSTETEEEVRI
jgi:PleD family two-component response regulator